MNNLFIKVVLLIIVILLCLLKCSSSSSSMSENVPEQKSDIEDFKILREIAKSDPVQEATKNIAQKKIYLYGVYGMITSVPGFSESLPLIRCARCGKESEYQIIFQKRFAIPVHLIEGTAELLISKEHRDLNRIARNYAEKYNTLLLRYLNGFFSSDWKQKVVFCENCQYYTLGTKIK